MKLAIVEENQVLDEEYQDQNNEILAIGEDFRASVKGKLEVYQDNEGSDEEDHEQNNEFLGIVEGKEHFDQEIGVLLKKNIVSTMSLMALLKNFLSSTKKMMPLTMNSMGPTKNVEASASKIRASTSRFHEMSFWQEFLVSGDRREAYLPPGLMNGAVLAVSAHADHSCFCFSASPRIVGTCGRGL